MERLYKYCKVLSVGDKIQSAVLWMNPEMVRIGATYAISIHNESPYSIEFLYENQIAMDPDYSYTVASGEACMVPCIGNSEQLSTFRIRVADANRDIEVPLTVWVWLDKENQELDSAFHSRALEQFIGSNSLN